MRFASLAGSLMVVLSTAALGAQGDHLIVTGNGVNVRAEPELGARILLQVYRNDLALEVGREGDWVEVRLPDRDIRGWIHGSLLSVVNRAGHPEPAAGPTALEPAPAAGRAPAADEPGRAQLAAVDSGDPLIRFRDSVTYLNNRAVAAAGIDLFTDVKPAGDGVVQVTATDAWNSVPRSGQDSFMRTLFDRWSSAAGSAQPLKVQVVDRGGQVLNEKAEP